MAFALFLPDFHRISPGGGHVFSAMPILSQSAQRRLVGKILLGIVAALGSGFSNKAFASPVLPGVFCNPAWAGFSQPGSY